MGSKTPQNGDHGGHGEANGPIEINRAGGEPRGAHTSRDGDGCLGDAGGDDDGDGDDDDDDKEASLATLETPLSTEGAPTDAPKKRKKSKPRKRKKNNKDGAASSPPSKQSSPPRIPLSDLFPNGDYFEGEVQLYTKGPRAAAAGEARYDALRHSHDGVFLQNYRKAAEVHRQTRQWVQRTVKPGDKLMDIANGLEDSVRALLGHDGLEPGDSLKAGMGFPTGICLNNQVAHYTPNPGQKDVVLQKKDLMTVDFGVHINGWIVDSAFTMSFDPVYDNLLAAVKDATNTGVKAAGIDVRICDVSAAIQEAMESYEVELGGKTYPVKPIRNLSAHNITSYHIHGGKSIPFVKNSDTTKMEEGEVFAIETFGTTGRGYIYDDAGIYGYGLKEDAPLKVSLPLASARRLHKTIRENFGTIVFCRRYIERLGVDRYLAGMNSLISHGIVEAYEPLCDIPGSYSAQFEHTLILHETHKEILSRGDDY
ncbi:methionine aminopeptidase, type II [Exophiala oligosperma]|uniref:Methionine aminopeptidase 2 n=1 Tax=Exophiala oligosperma TaxID=215243 RepID=A0A0D2DNP5_9EURO|nr:methionine aminopeptidase, type II [Exophiala oligosperma]KIW44125.1 methionine aminopeptidase, type II [Exophiala oligosperma]